MSVAQRTAAPRADPSYHRIEYVGTNEHASPVYALCTLFASFLCLYCNLNMRPVGRAFLGVVTVGRQRCDGQLIRLRDRDLFPVEVVVAVGSNNRAVLCAGKHAHWLSQKMMNIVREERRRAEREHDASRNRE